MKNSVGFKALVAIAALAAMPSVARAQIWTTWTSAPTACTSTSNNCPNNGLNNGTFSGTLSGASVTFNGNFDPLTTNLPCKDPNQGSQLSIGLTCDYWSPTAPYTTGGLTAPDVGGNIGMIQFNDAAIGRILFGTPVVNPFLAFVSVGQPGIGVTYSFTSPSGPITFGSNASVLSDNTTNCAIWGCGTNLPSGNSITGNEFSGTIRFTGVFSELDFTTSPDENWHAFTVGAQSVVPEPATMTLLGTGLVALAGLGRRRKRSA